MISSKSRFQIHYAWVITIGCGIMLFYSIGLTINCFSIFLTPLMKSLQLSSSQGSLLVSIQNISSMIAMLVVSPLYKKIGVRKIAYAAGLLLSFGYFIYSQADSIIQCHLAAIITGLGFGAGSLIPVSILISVWFHKKGGLALGMASACTGIATIIFPPIFSKLIERVNLTSAFLFNSIFIFILATVTVMLIRNTPSDIGLLAYGQQDKESIHLDINTNGITFEEALRAKKYYLMIAAIVFVGITIQPTISHIAVFYTSSGYDPVHSAYMVSLYGVMMIVFKPVYGFIIDKFGLMISTFCTYFLMILGFFSAYHIENPICSYIFVACLGVSVAPFSTIGFTLYTQAIFGKKDFARIFSSIKFVFVGISSLSSAVPGIINDFTGSYSSIFLIYILCSGISFVLMLTPLKGEDYER
ncbi:MAG: MFS transporter [Caldicoprobacterales bacterium]